MDNLKTCTSCKNKKTLSCFSFRKASVGWLSPCCKSCSNVKNDAYRHTKKGRRARAKEDETKNNENYH